MPADKTGGEVSFAIKAAGQVYNQTIESEHLGGAISRDEEFRVEMTRRLQRVWECLSRYNMEIYERPGVLLRRC